MPNATIHCITQSYLRLAHICCPDIIHLFNISVHWWCKLHIWTGGRDMSGRMLHIWVMGVTYLDHGGYISGRVLHIWAMGVTYLDDCYISRRLLHICTPQWKKNTSCSDILSSVHAHSSFFDWKWLYLRTYLDATIPYESIVCITNTTNAVNPIVTQAVLAARAAPLIEDWDT